jgi:Zn-dependent protease
VAALLGYLVFVNLLLRRFNLVYGSPPWDGGQVPRSIVWGLRRATQVALYAGHAIGELLIF